MKNQSSKDSHLVLLAAKSIGLPDMVKKTTAALQSIQLSPYSNITDYHTVVSFALHVKPGQEANRICLEPFLLSFVTEWGQTLQSTKQKTLRESEFRGCWFNSPDPAEKKMLFLIFRMLEQTFCLSVSPQSVCLPLPLVHKSCSRSQRKHHFIFYSVLLHRIPTRKQSVL